MKEKPKKNTHKKRVVKIKENDLKTSKEFLSTLDKYKYIQYIIVVMVNHKV